MRILFLAHLFPLPLDSGGKIKSFYTIKTLAAEHEVHLLAYVRTEEELKLIDQMKVICSSVHTTSLRRGRFRQLADAASSAMLGRSFIVSRDYRRDMQEAFDRLVAELKPDVVHVDHLQMAQFIRFDEAYATLLDHHNIESQIIRRVAQTARSPFTRAYASMEWPKLQRYELRQCRKFDRVLTVSDEDRGTLLKLDPSVTNAESVPIGVDVDYFQPVERNRDSKSILSVGTMYWPPNVDSMIHFCDSIFPLVKEHLPGSTLTIAGQNPTPAVQALASETVKVTGYVEDVRRLACDCGVFIVPLRSGSGVRVKLLNAFAMGLPVVSTSVGAEGLDVVDGRDALIADSPTEFADAVVEVLNNPGLADSLGHNARELVCNHYSWDAVGKNLLDSYHSLLSRRTLKMR